MGPLQDPDAAGADLAQRAAPCGAGVTPRAVEQRPTPKRVQSWGGLFRRASRRVFGSQRPRAPLLRRLRSVTVLGRATIPLPDSRPDKVAGCGGRHGGGAAAMRSPAERDARRGAVPVTIEAGRGADGRGPRQRVRRGAGALRSTGRGYCRPAVSATVARWGAPFRARLPSGTRARWAAGAPVAVRRWPGHQAGPFGAQAVVPGQGQARAWRRRAGRAPDAAAKKAESRVPGGWPGVAGRF